MIPIREKSHGPLSHARSPCTEGSYPIGVTNSKRSVKFSDHALSSVVVIFSSAVCALFHEVRQHFTFRVSTIQNADSIHAAMQDPGQPIRYAQPEKMRITNNADANKLPKADVSQELGRAL